MSNSNNDLATGAVILFIIVGVLGIDLSSDSSSFEDRWHGDCIDNQDNNNDGDFDTYIDVNCQNYPYNDGLGENLTVNPFPGSADDYEPFDDFLEYAEKSYSTTALTEGYPGSADDWPCDLHSMGSADFVKNYDIKYGTNEDGVLDSWINDNCIISGNGIMNPNLKPVEPIEPEEGEEDPTEEPVTE